MISHLDREKRKKKLRADNQDAWRESVDFTKSINTISKVEGMLEADLDDPDNVRVTDVGKARLLLDSKWKRINKLLPDLKQSDITSDGEALAINFKMNLD